METALNHLRRQGKLDPLLKKIKNGYVKEFHNILIVEFGKFLEKIILPNDWHLETDFYSYAYRNDEHDFLDISFGRKDKFDLVSAKIQLYIQANKCEFYLKDCVAFFEYGEIRFENCEPENIKVVLKSYDDFDRTLEKIFS